MHSVFTIFIVQFLIGNINADFDILASKSLLHHYEFAAIVATIH